MQQTKIFTVCYFLLFTFLVSANIHAAKPQKMFLPWSENLKEYKLDDSGHATQGPYFFKVDSVGNIYVAQAQTRAIVVRDSKTGMLKTIEPSIGVSKNPRTEQWMTVDPWSEGIVFRSDDERKFELKKIEGSSKVIDATDYMKRNAKARIAFRNGRMVDFRQKRNVRKVSEGNQIKGPQIDDDAFGMENKSWFQSFDKLTRKRKWILLAPTGLYPGCKELYLELEERKWYNFYLGDIDKLHYYFFKGRDEDLGLNELFVKSDFTGCVVAVLKIPNDIAKRSVGTPEISMDGKIYLMTTTSGGLEIYGWDMKHDF